MRALPRVTLLAALCLQSSPAWAEPPDPALALLAGASVFVAGFAAGGMLVASSGGDSTKDDIGWLLMESGFALAPLAAHGASGEWARGARFAALPAAALAANSVLVGVDGSVVEHGPLGERYVLWALLGTGLLSGVFGVIDSTFADQRATTLAVMPAVGPGQIGASIGGAL